MHLIWSRKIEDDDPWEPEYWGVFYQRDPIVHFLYKHRGDICSVSSEGKRQKLGSRSALGSVPLPHHWRILEQKNNTYLVLDRNGVVDLSSGTVVRDIPPSVSAAYERSVKPESYYVEGSFSFGEYRISHYGQCGYMCEKNGETVWKFQGRAYLFTDMVLWNDLLLFGTAGRGGYFYVLDIHSGKPVFSIKTGGTTGFVQVGDLCYVLQESGQANLLCVDLSAGEIRSQCALPGVATENSRIELIGSHIHTITFSYSNRKLKSVNWNCCDTVEFQDRTVNAKITSPVLCRTGDSQCENNSPLS